MTDEPPRLALTVGDPCGIGPEIAVKMLADAALRALADLTVVAPRRALHDAERRLGLAVPWRGDHEGNPAKPRLLGVDDPANDDAFAPGRWTEASGRISAVAVRQAVRLCGYGDGRRLAGPAAVEGVVTGPIAKAAWHAAGFDFPGHTEYLAHLAGVAGEVMLLVGSGLRVALVTVHEPLRRVPALVTVERIRAVARTLDAGLREDFGFARPRIAVLGLNPHAGEEGDLGSEEIDVIRPAVEALAADGIDAIGPLPADTAFHFARAGRYDAVLAMYHDQGLAPLKTVAFDDGVNVTLGLPFVRTSVDHGTAFDLAGKGQANPASFVAALRLAADAVHARRKSGKPAAAKGNL